MQRNDGVCKRKVRERAKRAGKIGGALASPRPWKCQSLRRGHRRVLDEVATFAVSAIPPPLPLARGPINLSAKLWCIPNQFTGLLVIKFANTPAVTVYRHKLPLARSLVRVYLQWRCEFTADAFRRKGSFRIELRGKARHRICDTRYHPNRPRNARHRLDIHILKTLINKKPIYKNNCDHNKK